MYKEKLKLHNHNEAFIRNYCEDHNCIAKRKVKVDFNRNYN